MKSLIRVLVALIAAAVLVWIGFAVLGHDKPALGEVYDTDFRGPKITFDGMPQVERAPEFRIRVGASSKKARWVKVNIVQFTSCSEGNSWNGTLCSKFDLRLVSAPDVSGRTVTLILIGGAMVIVPLAAASELSVHHD